jgi:hypothetical protein
MTRITIDADLRQKLMNFTTPLELCDEGGHVLGHLMPSTPWSDPEDWVEITPPVTEEEMQRRLSSDEPTYSTSELIEKLKRV